MVYSPVRRYELFSKCEWSEIAQQNEEVERKEYTSWRVEDIRPLLDSAIARYFLSKEGGAPLEEKQLHSLLSYIESHRLTDPMLRLDAEKLLCHLDPHRKESFWINEAHPKRDALREFINHAVESGCDSCSVFSSDETSPLATYTSRSFTGRSNMHSTTKSVTGLAVLMLHDRGLLDLRTPIVDLLPVAWREEGEWSSSLKREITILHLLTHTSGMVEAIDTNPGSYTQRAARRPLREAGPAHLGGPYKEFLLYSNFGVQLLGAVISGVAGERAGEFIRREIFLPLGMTHTTLREAGDEHVLHGDMYSTPRDLAELGSMIIKGASGEVALLSQAALDLMFRPDREHFQSPLDKEEVARCCLWYRYPYGVVGTSGDYENDIYLMPDERLVIVRTHDWPPRPKISCLQKIYLLKS